MTDPRNPAQPPLGQPPLGQPPAGAGDAPPAPPPAGFGAPGYTAGEYAPPRPTPVLSIISLVTGILGIVSFGFGFVFSIAAIVLGFMGRKREPAAKAMWLTGIITGFIGIGIALVWLIFFIIWMIALGTPNIYPRY